MRWMAGMFARTTVGVGLIGVALCATRAEAQEKRPTAREVEAAIQEHIGVPWMSKTVDTFKAGNPDTPVTGIAVTMMATLDVLQRAAANGQNLIITHEPTFFNHYDDKPEGMDENDVVWKEKRAFIEQHKLIIWRLHDHWHMRKPDGIQAGMTHALGWEKFQDPSNPHLFTIPETTLSGLATDERLQHHRSGRDVDEVCVESIFFEGADLFGHPDAGSRSADG